MSTRLAGRALPSMFLTVLLSFGSGLLAQDVHSNAMPGTDFSKYHTYKWVNIEGASHPNQIVDAEIKQAINTQLQAKGLTMTTGDKADLYVGYQTAVRSAKAVDWIRDGRRMALGRRNGDRRRVQLSTLEAWLSICMIRRPSNSCGLELRPRPSIRVPVRKRTRRIWISRWRSCSRISRHHRSSDETQSRVEVVGEAGMQ